MGKKRKLDPVRLVDYFGGKRLGLKRRWWQWVLREIQEVLPGWQEMIRRSFMDSKTKEGYEGLMIIPIGAIDRAAARRKEEVQPWERSERPSSA